MFNNVTFKIILGLVCFFVTCGLMSAALYVYLHTDASSITQTTEIPPIEPLQDYPTIDEARTYWNTLIQNHGAEQAYASLKSQYQDRPHVAHAAAHTFGALLYNNVKMDGLLVCDTSFGFGCYHSFVTSAIVDHGSDYLPNIVRTCIDVLGTQAGSCIHGIGHGLMEYFGSNQLPEALAHCLTLQDIKYPGIVGACEQGVFMDYNVPTDEIVRQVEHGDMFAPCNNEALSTHAQSCYYGLPHWWFQLENITAAKVVSLCAEVPQAYASECYTGMGIDLPGNQDYVEADIINVCSSTPTEETRNVCLITSAGTLASLGLPYCKTANAQSIVDMGCTE